MKLTQDQKRALYIVGGAAAIFVLFYLLNRGNSVVPGTATGVQNAPLPDTAAPTYMDYNVGGLNPPPSLAPIANPSLANALQNCGCNNGTDGCFSSSPLDTGRGPVTLDQLVNWYSSYHPGFTQYVQDAQAPYETAPATLAEQAAPPFFGLRFNAADRLTLGLY